MGQPSFEYEQMQIPQEPYQPVRVDFSIYQDIAGSLPGWIIILLVSAFLIGFVVILLIFLKITPTGKIVANALTALREVLQGLIEWKPRGNKKE